MYILLHHYSINEDSDICFLGKNNIGINIPKNACSYFREKKVDEKKLINVLDKPSFNKLINDGIIIPENINMYSRTGKKVLVVQPHSDDFALSCSGTILKSLEEKNIQLYLLTVFTKQNFDSSPWKNHLSMSDEAYSRLRLCEDKSLCDYLKCDYTYFTFDDITKRNSNSMFSKKGLLKKDLLKKDKLKNILIEYINKIKPEEVYVPLGIGYHIDHLITVIAVFDMIIEKKADFDVFFYEDYPYCNSDKVNYWFRIREVQNLVSISPIYINITKYLFEKSILINFYKSQFIKNRLVLIKEDVQNYARAISIESDHMINQEISDKPDYAERLWKLIK